MSHQSRSDQVNLRLPKGMRDRLKEIASTNRRSVNSEIITILEREIYDHMETKTAPQQA